MSQVKIYPKSSLNEPQQVRTEVEPKPKTGLIQHIVVTGVLLTSGTAFAAEGSVDVSSVISTITGAVATVSAIGLAVLSLFVTAKVFKWVKTAM